MSTFTINSLKISTENEDALKKAKLVIQSQIEDEEAWDCSTIKDIFDKNIKLHIFEIEFNPWSPPFETYAGLQAIEGISIDASWVYERDHYDTRYRWTGEGCYYEKVETGLNGWESDYQIFQEHLKWEISDLQKQRDNLDLAINALRNLGAPASEGDFQF